MLTRERECCLRIVIKFSIGPGDGVVTRRANHRSESCLRVRRIRGRVVFVEVAAAASGRRIRVVPAGVALRALQA